MPLNNYAGIGFADFRRFAADKSLSQYERIGFPDSYREGFESAIFSDIRRKLTNLDQQEKCIVDIGPGCSDLPLMLIDLCRTQTHKLILIDSDEMLAWLPNEPFIDKIAGLYPNCPDFITTCQGAVDVILCYSVLHYAFVDTAFFKFFDSALSMLAPQGQMLLGDIPNISKRKRFFASETGAKFHQNFMQTSERPAVEFSRIEHDQIDDAVLMSLIQRARSQGFDAYLLPQPSTLPMANRREDILITCP